MRARNISPIGATSKTTNINTENALFKNSGINAEDAINRVPPNRARCEDRMGKRRVKLWATVRAENFPPVPSPKKKPEISWLFQCDMAIALQRAAILLLALNRLKQSLEIALAKRLRTLALDDLEEHRRTIKNGLREQLQQIPFVVAVNQNAKLLQWSEVFVDGAYTIQYRFVVR